MLVYNAFAIVRNNIRLELSFEIINESHTECMFMYKVMNNLVLFHFAHTQYKWSIGCNVNVL